MFVRRIPYQSVRRRKIQQLAAAARPAGRAGADHPGVRAAVHPAATTAGADRRRRARSGRAARQQLQHGLRRSLGARARRRRATQFAKLSAVGPRLARALLLRRRHRSCVRRRSEIALQRGASTTAKPGAAATRYAPALKVAGSILAESPLPRREVVLISDFQRGGWRGEEGARLPQGATLTPVADSGRGRPGRTSASPACRSRARRSRIRSGVTVTAGRHQPHRAAGDRAARIALEIGGLPVANKPLNVEPGGSASVTFEPVTISVARTSRARCGSPTMRWPPTTRSTSSCRRPSRCAHDRRPRQRRRGLYLTRALAIGEAPRFETVVAPAGRAVATRTCGAARSWC